MRLNQFNFKLYIYLFLIAFAVVFSSTYNPFNLRRMNVDSSVYVTIAQGINRGQLPYKDFVDNKGPLTYLISAQGLYWGGFTGIWITELIFIFVSVFFAWKTALFFGNKYKSMLGTIFTFSIFLAFFTVNAGTEEYALPFLFISFYIFTKYYFSKKQDVNFTEVIILGFCFSCAVMIKLNMFPLWAGFCLVIFIECLLKQQFFKLIKYVCGFCIGIIIVFIPIFLYMKINGILNDFWNLVVIGGAVRGFGFEGLKKVAKNFYVIINRKYSFLPLFFGLYYVIKNCKKQFFYYYIGYTFSYALILLFHSLTGGGSHFNMTLIPHFTVALTVLLNYFNFSFLKIKTGKIVLLLFLCLVFSEGLVKYIWDISKIMHDKSGKHLMLAGKMIDENTNPDDRILSLMNCYIYPFTQRRPVSKYIFQGGGILHIPGAREEFLSDVLTNKPAIIAVFTGEDNDNELSNIEDYWHGPIVQMIENDYQLLSDENDFLLYIKVN